MASTLTKPRRCRRCGAVTVMQGAKSCSNCAAPLLWSEVVDIERAADSPPAATWRTEGQRPGATGAPQRPRKLFDALREMGERIEQAEREARAEASRHEGREGAEELPPEVREREALASRQEAESEQFRPRPRPKRSSLRWLLWALVIGAALLQNLLTPERIREIKEWIGIEEAPSEPAETSPGAEADEADEAPAVREARGALGILAKTIDLHAMRTGAPPEDERAWRRTFEYQLAYDRVRKHFAEGTRPRYEIVRETSEGRWYRLTAVARDEVRTEVVVEGVARVRARSRGPF